MKTCHYPRCHQDPIVRGEFSLCRKHALEMPSDVRRKILNGTHKRKDVTEVLVARGDYCEHFSDPQDCKHCYSEAANKSKLFHMR